MRQIILVVLGFSAVVLLVACATGESQQVPITTSGNQDKDGTSTSFPIVVTDDRAIEITIDKAPSKIVSLAPSNTEILFAIGLGDKVVGVDEHSDYPPEAKTREKIGGFAEINIEKVLSLEPDLVLATSMHSITVVPALEKQGLKVLLLSPPDVEAQLMGIMMVGKATGYVKEAKSLTNNIRQRLDAVTTTVKAVGQKPRVFFELDATLFTVGPGTFADDLITRAGGVNIASEAKTTFPQLNLEVLVQKDPQVIFLADYQFGETPKKVAARPGWKEISAVKESRIYPLDPDLGNRPGPRVAEALEVMAEAIHPELFK